MVRGKSLQMRYGQVLLPIPPYAREHLFSLYSFFPFYFCLGKSTHPILSQVSVLTVFLSYITTSFSGY